MAKKEGNNSIGNLIIQIFKVRRKKTNAMLMEAGIHSGQDVLLYYLSAENGQTVSSLVQKMGIQHATIFTMIKRMESAGMITKQKDSIDKRTSRIYITQKGKMAIIKISKVWKLMEATAINRLTVNEQESLRKSLTQILRNYEENE